MFMMNPASWAEEHPFAELDTIELLAIYAMLCRARARLNRVALIHPTTDEHTAGLLRDIVSLSHSAMFTLAKKVAGDDQSKVFVLDMGTREDWNTDRVDGIYRP